MPPIPGIGVEGKVDVLGFVDRQADPDGEQIPMWNHVRAWVLDCADYHQRVAPWLPGQLKTDPPRLGMGRGEAPRGTSPLLRFPAFVLEYLTLRPRTARP